MTSIIRIPQDIYRRIMADLARPHEHALERVGFCRVKYGNRGAAEQLILVVDYWPVSDDQYVFDDFAARINNVAIRTALQTSLSTGDGIFHVHMHDLPGIPRFSKTDAAEIPRIVQSLGYTTSAVPHGMLVFSHNGATAEVCMPGDVLRPVDRITVVGQPTAVLSGLPRVAIGDRSSRQNFLGAQSEARIKSIRIGIVGVSGGGSPIAQQLAHIGFSDFVFFDAQAIEPSNLNRIVGATEQDVADKCLKVAIAERLVNGINSGASVNPVPAKWQNLPQALRACDIVVGALDGFGERGQLEAACRRYLIPLVDVGMDVTQIHGRRPRLAGQVILSLPRHPCFRCIGFLNQKNLTLEAQAYGDAGPNPQVVWPNGVLASTAVGIVIELVTGWNQTTPGLIYKSYDGNSYNVTDHPLLAHVPLKCVHYRADSLGDPIL